MARVRLGAIEIGYDVHGRSGDWVLLIMGHSYARWGWNWQVADLARAHRVITFDNRGAGESSAPPGPYSVEQMAGDALGLLDELHVERAHVVGSSLGGCIALEVALGHADRVGKLVLMSTSAGGANPTAFPIPDATISLIHRVATLPSDERLRLFVANALSPKTVAARPELVDEILAFRRAQAQPIEAWQAQATAYPAYDASPRLGGLQAETLVVTGTQDAVVDARNSGLLVEAIPRARLVEMPGGHLIGVEQASEMNNLLAGFFARGFDAIDERVA